MQKKSMIRILIICLGVSTFFSFRPKLKNLDPAPLVFWTANPRYGPIEIFVDNVYRGDITMYYQSAPPCASQGCVTVMITGIETFTAQTRDGKYKWSSFQHSLTADACNSFQMQ